MGSSGFSRLLTGLAWKHVTRNFSCCAMSYRDIRRGPELKREYDKYQEYLEKSRAEKQQAYKALKVNKLIYETQVVWIAPFGQTAKTAYVQVEICATGQPAPCPDALKMADDYFVKVDPAAAGVILDRSVFPLNKLAKIVVKQRINPATEETQSRITGRFYKRHQNNSVSIFLGKNVDGDGFDDAVKAIKLQDAYKDFIKVKGNTVSFIPEG